MAVWWEGAFWNYTGALPLPASQEPAAVSDGKVSRIVSPAPVDRRLRTSQQPGELEFRGKSDDPMGRNSRHDYSWALKRRDVGTGQPTEAEEEGGNRHASGMTASALQCPASPPAAAWVRLLAPLTPPHTYARPPSGSWFVVENRNSVHLHIPGLTTQLLNKIVLRARDLRRNTSKSQSTFPRSRFWHQCVNIPSILVPWIASDWRRIIRRLSSNVLSFAFAWYSVNFAVVFKLKLEL